MSMSEGNNEWGVERLFVNWNGPNPKACVSPSRNIQNLFASELLAATRSLACKSQRCVWNTWDGRSWPSSLPAGKAANEEFPKPFTEGISSHDQNLSPDVKAKSAANGSKANWNLAAQLHYWEMLATLQKTVSSLRWQTTQAFVCSGDRQPYSICW